MLLIIQNDPEVPPGNFAAAINELKVPCLTVHPYIGEVIPPVREVSAAIVLGGAMGVHDTGKHPFLVRVKAFIRECMRTETPFLGVCLGGQLLAEQLGGRVIADSQHAEKGTLPVTLTAAGEEDPLFTGISREFISFQWHNDSFEIPANGTHLAFSVDCPGQAFRIGPCAWGTQFHPEVDCSIVDCWARWTEETAPLADQFLADFARTEQTYLQASRRLLGNFLRMAGFTLRVERRDPNEKS
ncbi:MAG TPA: type 1 glutamine amidotransferase [Geobacteraceae bacterium]|nr:type 1 glutamine amidotransferase [Geobacteraceae bacterium]